MSGRVEDDDATRTRRDAHPPPPYDPFQRYQSHWPRSERDDENPFIRFRRYADEQFRAMFGPSFPFRPSTERRICEAQEVRETEQRSREMRNIDDEWVPRIAADVNKIITELDAYERLAADAHGQHRAGTSLASPRSAGVGETDVDVPKSSSTSPAAPSADPMAEKTTEELDPFTNPNDFWPYMLRSDYSPLRLALDADNCEGEQGTVGKYFLTPPDKMRMVMAFTDLFHHTQSENVFGTALSEVKSDCMKDQKLAVTKDEEEELVDSVAGNAQVPSITDAPFRGQPEATPVASMIAQMAREVEDFAGSFAKAFSFGETIDAITRTPHAKRDSSNSIVSTMTRTETRTLPDGSVETKRVLKRRFADGKEETEETIDRSQSAASSSPSREVPQWLRTHLAAQDYETVDKTTQTQAQTQTSSPMQERSATPHQKKVQEAASTGGWFWR